MLKRIRFPLGAFAAGAVMFILVFLPELIDTGGAIILTGDYNMQSIPFVYHIWDAVHTGALNWDWSTGLGSQFLGSYAYYNLFSPFTLLYFLFPRSALLTAITVVSAVKYGTGTMLAYFYIRRFVKDPNYAVVGGLVYMFSSFAGYNLIFHFADVFALFPLLLIALEELCVNGRKGVFALAVLLMALTNYYFFFGQAVFCVIYYFTRCSDKAVGWSWKRLFTVAGEALMGVCMAMAVMLPVVLSLLDSPKATSVMSAGDMLAFDSIFYYLKILQSAFMVPDPFYFVSLFPAGENVYPFGSLGASVAAYLPLFSAAGVISYSVAKKHRSWENILLWICVAMAFVPALNQLFSALNSGYYARWLYMPLLISAMVSVKGLEEQISYKSGIITCGAAVAALLIYNFTLRDERQLNMLSRAVTSMAENLLHFGVTVVCFVLLVIVCRMKRDKEFFPKLFIMTAAAVYITFGTMSYYLLTTVGGHSEYVSLLDPEKNESRQTDNTARFSVGTGETRNLNLVYGVENVRYFNSLLDPGFQTFLDSSNMKYNTGIYRDIDAASREISDLCSVRYFLNMNGVQPEDCTELDKMGDWHVFENDHYIPMGFVYDAVISSEDFARAQSETEGADAPDPNRLYLKYLVVDDPSQYADILRASDDISPVSDEEYAELIEARRAVTCTGLERTTRGLTAEIDLEGENIVFFSASNNKGWRAYVDGEEREALWVNNGLIGVRTPAGKHSIRLEYTTRGFAQGCVVSAAGAAVFAAYMAAGIIAKRRGRKA